MKTYCYETLPGKHLRQSIVLGTLGLLCGHPICPLRSLSSSDNLTGFAM
jgi:hypothetical protein